jgi:hypothetical protein
MGQRSHEIAFCGVSAAIGTVLLLLGGLIPGATYCAPMLGMLPLLPALAEYGWRPALSVYAVTAALALLLAPDKELAGVYLFLGYYPVLQPALDRISSRLLRTVCKLAVFNGAVLALYFLLLHVLGLNFLESEFAAYSRPFLLVLLAGGNLVFLLLDRALRQLALLWRYRLRRLFFRH